MGQSVSTLRVALAAIVAAHQAKGLEFDAGDALIRRALKGISRERPERPQQVAPLQAGLLTAILEALGDDPIDVRDGALLALGFCFARRRSELTDLDLDVQGDGGAILERGPTHLTLTLVRSKTGDGLDPIVIPRAENRLAVAAIERWLALAAIAPGTPVLRRVEKGGHIGELRMHGNSIGRIIRCRVVKHLLAHGVPEPIARQEAERFGGHSLRHGLATTAAEAGATPAAIASVTGHKSAAILARYTRQADAKRLSPSKLAGVGISGTKPEEPNS